MKAKESTNTMKALTTRAKPQLAFLAALLLVQSSFDYDQATVGTYPAAAPTGTVDKSATASPNDLAGFTSAVTTAYPSDLGGVFNFSTGVATGTTLFRGTYGTSQNKRLQVTPSTPMQNVTTGGGSFTVSTSPNATTSTTDVSGYSLAIGSPTDATAGQVLPEAVVKIGFVLLSRTHATYPIDVRATVFFADGTSQSVTTNLANPRAIDDTFFGFTAPSGSFITNVALASFSPGTTTPVNTRIGLDDFGFVTASTLPPPQVLNVSPFDYAMAKAADGVQFEIFSYLPLPASGISVLLNSSNVTSQLVISGNDASTNRLVSFSGLQANQAYVMRITATNLVGASSVTYHFYTAESPLSLFNSGGFSNTAVYPLGPLQAVTNDGCVWVPPLDAAEIVDSADPQYGPVLREMQMGVSELTYLQFPPVASGVIRIAFDARVSNPAGRTLDMSLNAAVVSQQGSFLGWGAVAGQLAYYNGTAWVGLLGMDLAWHHYEFANYLSGPDSNKFDLAVDGAVVGSKLVFRTAFPAKTPMGNLRLGSMSGTALDYAEVDNLIITAGPATVPPMPVTLANVSCADGVFTFHFQSQSGAAYVVERSPTAAGGGWSDWITIPGDGTLKTVTDTNLVNAQFYRVRSQ